MTEASADLALLAEAAGSLREFRAGDVIFRRGDAGQELFIVKSGTVELRIGSKVLDTLTKHSIFGEMALIDFAPRSATAVALTDVTLVAVSDKQFTPLISSVALSVMREMSRRLRNHARESELMNIDAITGSFIHEIRQPLAAIAANSSAALRFLEMSQPDLEEVRLSLNRIVSVVHRADEVLDSLRGLFQRLDRPRPTNVNEIILEVLETMAAELSHHDVLPLLELTSPLPLAAGNKAQLRQVIINLIRNVIEAMDSINERKRLLLVRSDRRDGKIVVSVEDSGPGIDSKMSERIFEAFVTTKSHGMGLGLAICRLIVQHHSGELNVSSDGKSGAVFQLTLPVAFPDGSR